MEFPHAFDPTIYRARNPALAALSDDEARTHYDREGRAAGLVASAAAEREALIPLIAGAGRVLEIGPFCAPMLRGEQVEYLDVLDAAGLRARAAAVGADPTGCPETIHHVGGLDRVEGAFDAIVGSHSIEHQPDLVAHLRQVERLLAPDGAYVLLIPDKRYCFDHFLPESSIAQVLQARHERRTAHSLASVVEHHSLVTHNDPARHWAGDHGAIADQAERVRLALRRHEEAGDGYLDVHAWQFTPASFARLVETLGALGLTGLVAERVYDTPHGRNEFAAVLRLSPDARRRAVAAASGLAITIIQTADPERYRPMLEATARTVRAFCRRWGWRYESYLGVKRGPHPWQASYNRIVQLRELMERGYVGWVLHLDADAHVHDLDFDLAGWLADKGGYGAIFATSGVTGLAWDVNDGVGFINLGHEQGRRLVERWHDAFMALSDERLATAEAWLDEGNDQELLHRILEHDPAIAAATLVEGKDIINWPEARFVRQHLRTFTPGLEARTAAIRAETDAVLRRFGEPVDTPADDRWAARLFHPIGHRPALVEAPVPPPDPARAAAAMAALADMDGGPLTALFEAGGIAAVATELAALGRSSLGNGILGGAQQHRRARDPAFAGRLALWTHDKLVSLTEAIGVLPVELGEAGRWDENAREEPMALFARIEEALDADLAPPAHLGGHLGLSVRDGIVLHVRMLDAIHVAWTIRGLAEGPVVEIGGGAGLTAHYAARLRMADYRLVDRPTPAAIQAYVAGDAPGTRTWSSGSLAEAMDGAALLLNADTLPAMEPAMALDSLRTARRLGVAAMLSINQEAGLSGQTSVGALMAEAGGWRLARRHRHWLRQGYVEELWRAA